MSTETHAYGSQRYVPGDRYSECPRCGMDELVSRMIWDSLTGMWVCRETCRDEPGFRSVFQTKLTPKPTIKSSESIKRVDKQDDFTVTTTLTDGTWTLTNAAVTKIITFSLPAATSGQSVIVERVSPFAVRIDPDGSEVITGGGAGKYLQLDSDSAKVSLVGSAGVWTPTITGSSSFEA